MHSYIIQISKSPISKDDYTRTIDIEPSELIDYTSDIKDIDREDFLRTVVKWMPTGMFEYVNENCIRYLGGMTEWKKDYLEYLHKTIDNVETFTLFKYKNSIYEIERLVSNPLNTDILFGIVENGCGTSPQRSTDFMAFVDTLAIGDKIYVGSILDYHF